MKASPVTLHYFWKHVTKKGDHECWPWIGAKTPFGYGQMRTADTSWLAHRIAYYVQTGIDPSGKCVLHACDNPACVNSAHLFLGTVTDNNRDRHKKGRSVMPKNRSRGNKNGRAKLDDERVAAIRNMHVLGFSQASLARTFKVSGMTIWSIVHNKYWHHVK